MAKKFDQRASSYRAIQLTATADLSAGDYVAIEDVAAFCLIDVATGETFTAVVDSEKVYAEKATGAVVAGDNLYWDATAGKVTTTQSTNTWIGWAAEAAASADTHVYLMFDGRLKSIVAEIAAQIAAIP